MSLVNILWIPLPNGFWYRRSKRIVMLLLWYCKDQGIGFDVVTRWSNVSKIASCRARGEQGNKQHVKGWKSGEIDGFRSYQKASCARLVCSCKQPRSVWEILRIFFSLSMTSDTSWISFMISAARLCNVILKCVCAKRWLVNYGLPPFIYWTWRAKVMVSWFSVETAFAFPFIKVATIFSSSAEISSALLLHNSTKEDCEYCFT